jgi:tellurite resistance protein
MIDHHAALIYTMVIVSAADNSMPDVELGLIGELVGHLPIFKDYERNQLPKTLDACTKLLGRESGLEDAFREVKQALPPRLRETAYALACDVAAADDNISQEEARVLELMRHRLGVDPLVAAAIERACRARFAHFSNKVA